MSSLPASKGFEATKVAATLASKLAARTRHVSLLIGAGAGVAIGLPDIRGLEDALRSRLKGESKASFEALLTHGNIEKVLTRLRRISALVGTATFDGFDEKSAKRLDEEICEGIIATIDLPPKTTAPFDLLAAWVRASNYTRPIELFSVNYDLSLERAFENHGVPYFDGFVGAIEAFFRADLVDEPSPASSFPPTFARLWKLHGSINWRYTKTAEGQRIARLGQSAPKEAVAIYPSDVKYDESRRVPFLVLADRFRRSLIEPESVAIVSGYSFSDQHINETIFDAARQRPRSEFTLLAFADIPSVAANAALRLRNVTALGAHEAIMGGERQPWESSADVPGIYESGTFLLGDFGKLTKFLATRGGVE